jgi:hypothetical protein
MFRHPSPAERKARIHWNWEQIYHCQSLLGQEKTLPMNQSRRLCE